MKTKLNMGDVVLVVVVAFLIFLRIDGCNKEAALGSRNAELIKLVRSGGYAMTLLADGVAEQKTLALEMSNRQSRAFVQDDSLRREVKALRSLVKWHTETVFDTIRDTVPVDRIVMIGDTAPALLLPYRYDHDTEWFSFRQEIGLDGINEISGTTIRDSVEYMAYIKRKPWYRVFEQAEAVVRISHANPYVHVGGLENVKIEPQKGLFSKRWFWGAVGVVAGGLVVARLK